MELQDHGEAEFHRVGDGLLLRGGDPGRHGGDAVQLEQPFRFDFGQEGPTRGQDGANQVLGLGTLDIVVLDPGRRRRLVQATDVLTVVPHVVEGAGGSVGVGEDRYAGAVQDRLTGRDLVPPIQLASTGLPMVVLWILNLSAVWVGSVIAWGVKITSRPSVFGSLATTSSALI